MMRDYSDEQKAKLIARLLPPENLPVPQLSLATGIPKDTLYGWRSQARRHVQRLAFHAQRRHHHGWVPRVIAFSMTSIYPRPNQPGT